MKNKMLLVLYPDTFIWEQNNKTLMYNCSSKQTYPFEAIHPIDKYCRVLTDMQNLYVVEIRLTRMLEKQPPLLKVMDGTAEIIIREQRLLERLFTY